MDLKGTRLKPSVHHHRARGRLPVESGAGTGIEPLYLNEYVFRCNNRGLDQP